MTDREWKKARELYEILENIASDEPELFIKALEAIKLLLGDMIERGQE